MTKVELRNTTLEFVKRMLPDANEVDIETTTEKIVHNLIFFTKKLSPPALRALEKSLETGNFRG